MVIERFHDSDVAPTGERFRSRGRMLPDGVSYQASWLEPDGSRCFQLMEANSIELIDAWISHWNDLAHFERFPVVTSADFWQARQP